MAEDVLDLDALVPQSKQIKIGGNFYEIKPLTLQQLIQVARLEERMMSIKTVDEVIPLIKEVLGPIVPAVLEDKFELNVLQIKAIVQYAQKISVDLGDAPTEARQYNQPKKKDNLAEESPSSSDSTQDTPQDQS